MTPCLVVHSGAGDWPADRQHAAHVCADAAARALEVLRASGNALEAAVAAVIHLENDPLLNAGTGAVPTSDGTFELDACVMEGSTLRSGAVGALVGFKNPVVVANHVLYDGHQHLLVGDGAAKFGLEVGAELSVHSDTDLPMSTEHQSGNTVGAVALEPSGGLAAATSTGGVQGQRPGRIGDTPIVGAGTYADDFAAVSCTGEGDAFARGCTAYWATQRSRSIDAVSAATEALNRTRATFGGMGGLILLTHHGSYAAVHTMPAMPHAIAFTDGRVRAFTDSQSRIPLPGG